MQLFPLLAVLMVFACNMQYATGVVQEWNGPLQEWTEGMSYSDLNTIFELVGDELKKRYMDPHRQMPPTSA